MTFGNVATQGEWQRTHINNAEDYALSDYWRKSMFRRIDVSSFQAICRDEEDSMRRGCERYPDNIMRR